jgi:DNA-binding transcriptional ArsR family regulator
MIQNLDSPDVFAAISHPARRQILEMLTVGERPVNEIAAEFEMSRPAVSQHLRIMLDAGLLTEQRHGRERRYQIVTEALRPLRDWLTQYARLQRLKNQLKQPSKK